MFIQLETLNLAFFIIFLLLCFSAISMVFFALKTLRTLLIVLSESRELLRRSQELLDEARESRDDRLQE